MMVKAEVCYTCGRRLMEKGYTSFLCPSCGNVLIGRCYMCRDQSVKYTCRECNFSGP